MNDWHSIRFLLIGAVATIVVASSASLFIRLHMHLTTDKAMDSKIARAFKEKVLLEGEIIVEPVHERIEVYLTWAGWQDLGQIMEMTETVEIAGKQRHDAMSSGPCESAYEGTIGREDLQDDSVW